MLVFHSPNGQDNGFEWICVKCGSPLVDCLGGYALFKFQVAPHEIIMVMFTLQGRVNRNKVSDDYDTSDALPDSRPYLLVLLPTHCSLILIL